jgi:hypothetical protein
MEGGEDCPLCSNPLSKADQLYPLHCPTTTCSFQFCCECLQKLHKSSSDGYTEASDGSRQVKVSLRCPVCRGAYKNVTDESVSASNIVTAVLKLRRAASTPLPGHEKHANDSELSATALSARNNFLQDTCLKELQDSVGILQHYHDSIDDKDCGTVESLDWDAWRPFLQQHQSSPKNAVDDVLPRDPTLFMGLEDLLSTDEQEFITSMLVSGKTESVAQAAHLLHGILEVSAGRKAAATVQQIANFSSVAQVEHQHKVRKRFPLPSSMPRAVTLPVYNPLDKNPPLKFINKDVKTMDSSELTLAGVRGPAGKVGLRKGDVVTHVGGDRVDVFGNFTVALQQLLGEGHETVQITVNANDETARQLKERAQEMKKQGIRFH